MLPLAKKRKISEPGDDQGKDDSKKNRTTLASLSRSVTPPLTSRERRPPENQHDQHTDHIKRNNETNADIIEGRPRVIPSPFQLTHIRDLPSDKNVDTVQLHDILGDPMIRECWQFNYCFDVDFVMSQFDQDVKDLVQVKIVHGSWKQDSPNRLRIDEACARYPNVEPIVAYMPEPFGTHHSKMMILLRHDDLAQVIIHTANMLAGDWTNMSQALWRSPLLPLSSTPYNPATEEAAVFGTGARFKRDLLAYLEFYGRRKTGSLVDQLRKFDFYAIRAVLVASVPSKERLSRMNSSQSTLWGWPALKDALRQISLSDNEHIEDPHVVIQVSSIASLGQTDKWLKDVLFDSLCPSSILPNASKRCNPKFSIVFPTPDEIRRSLNGYGSGGSIHMKLQSVAQQKQLQYMRPYLCHWAGDQEQTPVRISRTNAEVPSNIQSTDAGRRRAAPHIKTYIRFSDKTKMDSIDWVMITSANLSTQAWGAAPNSNGEVRICSWEIGVLVWPQLIVGDSPEPGAERPKMVPCFQKDRPELPNNNDITPIVGFRMPYDLPLARYGVQDVPWCATINHPEPDWLGQSWEP
ncbi:tyrosyl-DNA phosphodiesterase, putative [Talaromyces stipitatus ATCC 10500]|uniref:Tyrosyl-DNA phosphodiesterase, putative n=1 Tax=Talaromyces stipitatus (strain ATCC 10500 / CBS 375.48 / QM 6759 / NRRL 1006) TaxID=441959 RepID=B8M8U7_TALSN|nr:tyrosyl-DNA phosphodiesterase, putative [Talaromyces stipitatus ATCC 10500]EED20610.1 tyrosyl-DNA phosphodiesterase, putative [Talaromyces stipitatus ATCC 10500]